MGSKSSERRKKAAIENSRAYRFYLNNLRNLALARLEWKDFPEEIDIDYMNETLLSQNVVFFKDEDLDEFLALQCVVSGPLNAYGRPTERQAIGLNGYTNTLNTKNSVLIKCAPTKSGRAFMTTIEGLEYYATELAEIDRTIVINIKRQKLPWMLQADKKLELTVEDFFEQVDSNVPLIPVDKDFGKLVEVLNLQAPLVAPQLYQLKQSIWNEALTFLGITNSSIEKRERVNVREVETNNAGTVMHRYVILAPLIDACNKINKMFGLNTSVEFRDNATASIDGVNGDESEDDDERFDDDN